MATENDNAAEIANEAPPRRKVMLPVVLLLATCVSTFWTGAVSWKPIAHLNALHSGWTAFVDNLPQGSPSDALEYGLGVARMDWRQGLLYMGAILGILLFHEMGHFVMAVRHRIPASLPYFIPVPVLPFGTMGAVISMEGSQANRRELFDMGIAGPLAGLALALPITWLGITKLPAVPAPGDSFCFHNPLIFQYMIAWLRPDYPTPGVFYLNQFNPFLMAGWLGMLVTGLNMLPISQFDGGHVSYALLGERGNLLARGLLIAGIVFVVYMEVYGWVIMLLVVILLGADHPPTVDDRRRMGWFRIVLGWLSLLIPVLCFNPLGLTPMAR